MLVRSNFKQQHEYKTFEDTNPEDYFDSPDYQDPVSDTQPLQPATQLHSSQEWFV